MFFSRPRKKHLVSYSARKLSELVTHWHGWTMIEPGSVKKVVPWKNKRKCYNSRIEHVTFTIESKTSRDYEAASSLKGKIWRTARLKYFHNIYVVDADMHVRFSPSTSRKLVSSSASYPVFSNRPSDFFWWSLIYCLVDELDGEILEQL